MKQFTSHIDFSLTKKRFEMMIKHYSPLRSSSRLTMLIPLIMVIALMFCTNQKESDYPHKLLVSDDVMYTSVDLYQDRDRAIEFGIERGSFRIVFDESGNPFTGTQQLRFVENDSLIAEIVYENGLIKSEEGLYFDGDSVINFRQEFDYIGEQFKAVRIFKDGILVEEWKDTISGELGFHKQWHPNGQLKYEAYYIGNLDYEGLMTLYDEEGNIIEQERYKKGELVERIK